MPETSAKNMEQYRNIFLECDKNCDNFISIAELKAYFLKKEHRQELPVEKIKYIFKLAHKDADRKVNFEEFVNLLEHPDMQLLLGHYMNKYVNFMVPRTKPKPEPVRKFIPKGRSVKIHAATDKKEDISAETLLEKETATDSILELFVQEDEELAYINEFTCCPPPFAMVLITLLELTFFLIDEFTYKDSTLTGSGVTAKYLMYEPDKRHEVWRFLTYMFVHIGYLHIVVNLAVQLILGIPLEMVHNWWRVSLLYFSGVIAGSLATSVSDPWVRLAGASGGVYSLLTAHIATIIMNWSEMSMPLVQLLVFSIIIVCDIGNSIHDRYFLNINNQIGFVAHFGGALAGLLVGIYILKNINVKSCERYLWWAALVTYAILMVSAVLLNILLPERYPDRNSFNT